MRNNWTKEQEDELILLIGQGKTNEQIAAKLGRTKSAVAHKRGRLFKEALAPEEPDPVSLSPAAAEEDTEEEGETELERELEYVRKLLDEQGTAFEAYANTVENNMAALMECVNELSKEKTVHEDELAELKQRAGYMAENLWQIDVYLSRGPLYRLFHSFRKFREGFPDGKRKS